MIALTVSMIKQNIINVYVFILLLLFDYFNIFYEPFVLVVHIISPQNTLFDDYQEYLLKSDIISNLLMNGLSLTSLSLLIITYYFIEIFKQPRLYLRVLISIQTFLMVLLQVAFTIPYLVTSFQYLLCLNRQNQDESCFQGWNIPMYMLNLVGLISFIFQMYIYEKCLNFNFIIPQKAYNVPWITPNKNSILVKFILYVAISLQYLYRYKNEYAQIALDIIILLALSYRIIIKFSNGTFFSTKLQTIDIFCNSTAIVYYIQIQFVYFANLTFSFNSFYLLIFLPCMFGLSFSIIYKVSQAKLVYKIYSKFAAKGKSNFKIDYALNRLIDNFCSVNRDEATKIKGLFDLIIKKHQPEYLEQRMQAKRQTFKKKLLDNKLIQEEPTINNYQSFEQIEEPTTYKQKQFSLLTQSLGATLSRKNVLKSFTQVKSQNKYGSTNNLDNTDFTKMMYASRASEQSGITNIEGTQMCKEDEILQEEDDEDSSETINLQNTVHSNKDLQLVIYIIDTLLEKENARKNQSIKSSKILISKIRLIYLSYKKTKLYYLMFLVSQLECYQVSFEVEVLIHIYKILLMQAYQAQNIIGKQQQITPYSLVQFENNREEFEKKITETTEKTYQLFTQLKGDQLQAKDIQKRFNSAKNIISLTIDLEKRFNKILQLNSQALDLVISYFHFLDQVIHQENEARNVFKIMLDLNNQNKISQRFEGVDTSNISKNGFILVSGNQINIGDIIKLNNTLCNTLQYFKEDLIGKKIETLMPLSTAIFHKRIISGYSKINNKKQQIKKRVEQENEILQENSQEEFSIKKTKLWHLNKKDEVLIFVSKRGFLQPLICNFDLHYDLQNGIQFLCIISSPKHLAFSQDKIETQNVYMIQTNGSGFIECCSENFIKRFGLNGVKFLDEHIDVALLDEQLTNLQDTRIDIGQPLFLNFETFDQYRNEENKESCEKYQKKIVHQLKNKKSSIQFEKKEECQQIQMSYVKRQIIPTNYLKLQQIRYSEAKQHQTQLEAYVFYIVFTEGMNQNILEQCKDYKQSYSQQNRNSNKISTQLKELLTFQTDLKQSNTKTYESLQIEEVSEPTQTVSQENYTFASTSSTSLSTSKDKISELKNENILSQVPKFVNLFKKIFMFYFILFLAVATTLVLVSFISNKSFMIDLESINISKHCYSLLTLLQISFRSFLNVVMERESSYSEVVADKESFLREMFIKTNDEFRIELIKLRTYINLVDNEVVNSLYRNKDVQIYFMNSYSQITQTPYSYDQAAQMLVSNVDQFQQITIGGELRCEQCFFSRQTLDYNRSIQRFRPQLERNAYFIIQNTNMFISNRLWRIGLDLEDNSSTSVDEYRRNIFVLVLVCIFLSFICAAAFLPYYLRMKKNQTINIYLIEKISISSLNEMIASIVEYQKVSKLQRGKYSQSAADDKMKNQQINDIRQKITNSIRQKSEKQLTKGDLALKIKKLPNKRKQDETVEKFEQKIEIKQEQKEPQLTLNTFKSIEILNNNEILNIEEMKEEEDTDSSLSDDNQERKKHRKQKRRSSKLGNQIDDIQIRQLNELAQKRNSINLLYFKDKIRAFISAIIGSLFLSTFFIIFYVMIASNFETSSKAIQEFRSFYNLDPCIMNILQLTRETLARNESEFFILQGQENINQVIEECVTTQSSVRNILLNFPKTLEHSRRFFTDLESNRYCSIFVPSIFENAEDCSEVSEGILDRGFFNAYSTVINYYQMLYLRYEGTSPANRSQEFIYSLLQDQKGIDYYLLYLRFFDKTLNEIKVQVTDSVVHFFNERIREFLIVFVIFIIVLVVIIVAVLCILMKNIQKDIYLTRKTIQLIPHAELNNQENYELASKIKY